MNLIDQLMAAFQGRDPASPAMPLPAGPGPTMGFGGMPGAPGGPSGAGNDPSRDLQNTPARQALQSILARVTQQQPPTGPAAPGPTMAPNAAGVPGRMGGPSGPSGSPPASPQAVQAMVQRMISGINPMQTGGLPPAGAPGITLDRPAGPNNDAMANLITKMQSGGMAPGGGTPGPAPPVPMPASFGRPVEQRGPQGPAIPPFQTTTTPADPDPGKGVREFLKAWAAGAAGGPNSKVGSFFRGADQGFKEQDRMSSNAAAKEEKGFKRGLETRKDARDATKERRAGRESEAKIRKIDAEIQKILNPNLTVDQRINLSRDGTNYGINLIKSNPGISDGEVRGKIRDYIKERETYVMGQGGEQKPQFGPPVPGGQAPAAPAKAPPAPGQIMEWNGQKFRFKGGAPGDKANYEQVG